MSDGGRMYASPEDSCISETSSVLSASSSASPFRRSRFEHLTRREALERRFATASKSNKSPDEKKDEQTMEDATPLVSNRSAFPRSRLRVLDTTTTSKTPPRTPERKLRSSGSNSSVATTEIESTVTMRHGDEGESSVTETYPSQPQHYYRVVFRGVVSLLSAPLVEAPRNDSYLSYGEVFASGWEQQQQQPSLEKNKDLSRSSTSPKDATIIRVDKVLTGGYSLDPGQKLNHERIEEPQDKSFGFLLSMYEENKIVEPLEHAPKIEEGVFLYKVISSSPLPILSGPAFDAPKTRAMALPASVHEVSLRMSLNGTWFLRLCHRRGWIADRRPEDVSTTVVQETQQSSKEIDCDQSILSSISVLSIATSTSLTRRRHRPPRRRADATAQDVAPKAHPRVKSVIMPNAKSSSDLANVSKRLTSPVSNVSILSDDSSADHIDTKLRDAQPTSPDASFATAKSVGSTTSSAPSQFFLMRVTAPRGLKILDAPHFQVNNLIHGTVSSSHMVSQVESNPPKTHHSIFQTMSGRTTGPSRTGNPAVFDSNSKTRILPRGVLFETSRRMEALKSTGAFNQGSGLIKLSDNSGWAIVPQKDQLDDQYRNYHGLTGVKEGEASRAFEEVGQAVLRDTTDTTWLRVQPRSGLVVSCPPPVAPNDAETSPTSSRSSSTISGSHAGSNFLMNGNDSDVASSVGSAFLDAMFRTPKKKRKDGGGGDDTEALSNLVRSSVDKPLTSDSVACGMCVEVEKWADSTSNGELRHDYARLRGGQGWLPMALVGKVVSSVVSKPEFRFGSFWFRVQSSRGIKARRGPSKKAPSIRSQDGAHSLRFECGEFLRASEVMTVFSSDGRPEESFAKLYRNRHVQLHRGHEPYRHFSSLTAPSEWVQIYNPDTVYLQECAVEPHIERHRQGWRYNVVPDDGVSVRKGPSFAAETTGTVLYGGESVIVTERVSPGGESITWLRLNDGQWVHDLADDGSQIMIAHSLRHRQLTSKPKKTPRSNDGKEIAYNAIVARLFHNSPVETLRSPSKDLRRNLAE